MKLAWIAYLSIIPCFAYAANESEPALSSHNPNLFDTSRDNERNYLAASKGKAERKGNTLYLWKDGYGPQEQGLLFHDWSIKGGPNSDDNGNSFIYTLRFKRWLEEYYTTTSDQAGAKPARRLSAI